MRKISTFSWKLTRSTTKKSTKKSLIDDLSKRLLELEFKSNHSIKSKCLKRTVQKVLPDYREWKNTQPNIKPIKTGEKVVQRIVYDNFKPQEVKMTNKVLGEKSNCVVCRSSKWRFSKQKII